MYEKKPIKKISCINNSFSETQFHSLIYLRSRGSEMLLKAVILKILDNFETKAFYIGSI